ncbi:hypothetical protein ACIBSV_11730 [Embleya sp. NPDC050154]|uniref:hypothetical protein n=1 Tax=Embleya sp. NPDC050154 TaxID=3363988 RepID=UPI00379D2C18
MTFHEHLRRSAGQAIAAVPIAETREIYAVSFYIDHERDDPRRPILTIGYNTETQVEAVSNQPAGRPSDLAEARWNYAFWLQNELAVIGDSSHDPAGARAREDWIREAGLWYAEPAVAADWTTAAERLAQQIDARFNEACIDLAAELHATGVIQESLGRPVPILIHELEYYDDVARWTEHANPPDLANEFTNWVRNG